MIPKKNVAYLQKVIDEDVQAAYVKLLLTGYRTQEIMYLKERSGVQPRFNDADVQAVYERLFMPLKDLLKTRHRDLHNLNEAFHVREATDVAPKMAPDEIEKRYETYFRLGRLPEAREFRMAIGILPSPELGRKYPKIYEHFHGPYAWGDDE